ncbi:hypothetical protein MVI27_09635 [Chryseobacterium salipaludis]|uniref:hypothetical protein n=1 Tax=Chryseobacterium TaxID=59732 RepID=UPI001FF2641B|nr:MULTISPECIES: hypothetical protein [Chryseobacterium]MCJ8498522.1 hypothetical protein [Chryseobacterium salipaludis]MCX3297153.1 hypothetical protein [Planobacterium sp. JC490]
MKKLLLATFGVAGLVSANTIKDDLLNFENASIEDAKLEIIVETAEHDWIIVETWCGKVFYLDNNHYSNFQQIDADAYYFTQQQCGPL